jgi:hypothetical protein
VKAEEVLPDRKYAKLWSGMMHEEYADEALPGAHALSGCNTTSSFFGNGKNLVYKILKDAASDIHDLDNLRDPDKDVAIHVKPGGSYGCLPLLECCTSQDNQRLPGLKQLSQFPDFQMNRQCNTSKKTPSNWLKESVVPK